MSPQSSLWEMLSAIGHVLWFFWPLTLLIIVSTLLKLGTMLYQRHRFRRSGIGDVDRMSGQEFEQFLEHFFQQQGYQVYRTPYQGDYGADLILRSREEKIVAQAKRHAKNVGLKAVQEVVAARDYYKCSRAMVVTNSGFTEQARALAKVNRVELWGREELITRLLAMQKPRAEMGNATLVPTPLPPTDVYALPVPPPSDDPSATPVQSTPAFALPPTTPPSISTTCAVCGKPVSPRVRAYCASRADLFQGQVYCYEHQYAAKSLRASS